MACAIKLQPGLEKLLVFALITITNTIATSNFQLQRKDSQNIVTNSLTHEASTFAYVNAVDLFRISIPDLLKPHFSLSLFCINFIVGLSLSCIRAICCSCLHPI